jgi:hypothetical protein
MGNEDFPTTGGWGQSDSQWKANKSQYEVMQEACKRHRDYCNRAEQIRDETQAFYGAIEKFAIVVGRELTQSEIDGLRHLWSLYSRKCIRLTERLNDSRNELKRMETDLYNFKQRR